MPVVQQLLQFAQSSSSQAKYELLPNVFVLPGEAAFNPFAGEVQILPVCYLGLSTRSIVTSFSLVGSANRQTLNPFEHSWHRVCGSIETPYPICSSI